jgi:hypothetical protein
MALHSFRTLLGQVPISKSDAVPRSLIDTDFVNYSIIYTKYPLQINKGGQPLAYLQRIW